MSLSSSENEEELLAHLRSLLKTFPEESSEVAEAALRELSLTETSLSGGCRDLLFAIRNLLSLSSKHCDAIDLLQSPPDAAVHASKTALDSRCRRQLLVDKSRELLSSLRNNNKRISDVHSQNSSNLEQMAQVAQERKQLLSPENIETLECTTEVYNTKLAAMKEELITWEDKMYARITEATEKLELLRARKAALEAEVGKMSAGGALPPDLQGAREKLGERQDHLDSLISTIVQQESGIQNFNPSLD